MLRKDDVEAWIANMALHIGDISFGRNLVLDSCGQLDFAGKTHVVGELIVAPRSAIEIDATDVLFHGPLSIGGSLTMAHSVLEAKEGMEVAGNVDARAGELSVTDRLVVEGNMRVNKSTLALPLAELSVDGDLSIQNTAVESWPDHIAVSGEMNVDIDLPLTANSHATTSIPKPL